MSDKSNRYCDVCKKYTSHTLTKEDQGRTLIYKCRTCENEVTEKSPFTIRPPVTHETPRPGLDYYIEEIRDTPLSERKKF